MMAAIFTESTYLQSDLNGRVAIVTGASSGLGANFARVLAKSGAKVVLAGRRAERLRALADELGADQAEAVPTDVADEAAVGLLVDRAVDRFGRPDGIVYKTGGVDGRPAEMESPAGFARVDPGKLTPAFYFCREG